MGANLGHRCLALLSYNFENTSEAFQVHIFTLRESNYQFTRNAYDCKGGM
jgi:hypothetical protein